MSPARRILEEVTSFLVDLSGMRLSEHELLREIELRKLVAYM